MVVVVNEVVMIVDAVKCTDVKSDSSVVVDTISYVTNGVVENSRNKSKIV